MDEVGFGPRRESRVPARYRRALAALAAAGIVTAGVVLVMHQATGASQVASPSPATQGSPAPRACPPTQTTKPNLAGLPAGMRPGALQVIVAAQFSGECPG
jgi:hypothetical protein